MSNSKVKKYMHDNAVNEAVTLALNNKHTTALSPIQYEQFVEVIAALSIGNMIHNKGHSFVAKFIDMGLKSETVSMCQQAKKVPKEKKTKTVH